MWLITRPTTLASLRVYLLSQEVGSYHLPSSETILSESLGSWEERSSLHAGDTRLERFLKHHAWFLGGSGRLGLPFLLLF